MVKRPRRLQHNQMLTHSEFILIEEESVVESEAMRGYMRGNGLGREIEIDQ